MFENKMIRGIHISRYIMSWARMGGKLTSTRGVGGFEKWLKTLVINSSKLSDEEIQDIICIADNGKLELELNAKRFLDNKAQVNSED